MQVRYGPILAALALGTACSSSSKETRTASTEAAASAPHLAWLVVRGVHVDVSAARTHRREHVLQRHGGAVRLLALHGGGVEGTLSSGGPRRRSRRNGERHDHGPGRARRPYVDVRRRWRAAQSRRGQLVGHAGPLHGEARVTGRRSPTVQGGRRHLVARVELRLERFSR